MSDIKDKLFDKNDPADLAFSLSEVVNFTHNQELLDLAQKVADQMQKMKDEDIEEWADRLSEDFAKLND